MQIQSAVIKIKLGGTGLAYASPGSELTGVDKWGFGDRAGKCGFGAMVGECGLGARAGGHGLGASGRGLGAGGGGQGVRVPFHLQLFTGCLGLAVVSLLALTKFSIWRGGWALGYHSMGFGHISNVS